MGYNCTMRILALILLAGMLGAGVTDGVGAEAPGGGNQLLVRFEPGIHAVGRSMSHAELGTARAHRFRRIPVDVVTIPEGADPDTVIAAYEARPDVAYAEPNHPVYVQGEPNDPLFDDLWGLHNTGQTGGAPGADIGAVEAWEHTTGSSEIIVAIIDTGVDYTHEDLADNMWENPNPSNVHHDLHGARWTNGDGTLTSGDPMDENSHGTHTAGTVGAVGNNELGVVGVNWDVRLMALRFMDEDGKGVVADAIAAIEYAMDHGAHVINASWGTDEYSESLRAILHEAAEANVLFVASAGNRNKDNDEEPFYPASFDAPNIIAVASSTDKDARSSFSNWGKDSVHVAAPGSRIKSALPDNRYGNKSGTSMAAPHVAGAAALFLSLNPGASHRLVKQRILETVTPLDAWEDLVQTGGRLNAGALVGGAVPTGELTVSIEPDEAVDAGARWRVVGEDAWRDSGDSVTLETGEYEVEFAVLDDWVEPSSVNVGIAKDTVTARMAAYERARGTLELTLEPEGARADGARWRVAREGAWRDSGDSVTLETGEYEVEFAVLDDWVEPSPVNVGIVKDTVTARTAAYERARGTLELTLEPEGARADGARWRVVGEGAWRDSGDSVTLETGEYEVEFTELEAWVTPSPMSVAITKGTVTRETARYVKAAGELRVEIHPEAVRAEARWIVNGAEYAHGETARDLAVGAYDVGFTDVAGWVTPAALHDVVVERDVLTEESAEYIEATGELTVTIEPPEARADGARWSVDGGRVWREGGGRIELEAGLHEVIFAVLDYWVEPGPVLVEVQPNEVTSRSVAYERGRGVLEVILEPPEAVAEGARWSVDYGATLRDSGEAVELDAGEHWILFTPLREWRSPDARPVEVAKDGVTTEHAEYRPREVEGLPVSRPWVLVVLAGTLAVAGLAGMMNRRLHPPTPLPKGE